MLRKTENELCRAIAAMLGHDVDIVRIGAKEFPVVCVTRQACITGTQSKCRPTISSMQAQGLSLPRLRRSLPLDVSARRPDVLSVPDLWPSDKARDWYAAAIKQIAALDLNFGDAPIDLGQDQHDGPEAEARSERKLPHDRVSQAHGHAALAYFGTSASLVRSRCCAH